MNLLDFISGDFFRATQIDTVQTNAQTGDDQQAVDGAMIGITRGLDLSPVVGTQVNMSPGATNNKTTGRRAVVATTAAVDVSPAGVNDPAAGNERIISIYVKPDIGSIPTPGSPTVQPEIYELVLEAGAEVLSPGAPVPPALKPDAILIGDVLRKDAAAQPNILVGDIDLTRRETAVKVLQVGPPSPLEISARSLPEALQILLDALGGATGAGVIGGGVHSSTFLNIIATDLNTQLDSLVTFLGSGDGTGVIATGNKNSDHLSLAATALTLQLVQLVTLLGDEAPGGDLVIGAAAKVSGGESVAAGTVATQTQELLDEVAAIKTQTITLTIQATGFQPYVGTISALNTFRNGRLLETSSADTRFSIPLIGVRTGDIIQSVTVYVNKVSVALASCTIIEDDNSLSGSPSSSAIQTNILAGTETLFLDNAFDGAFFPKTVMGSGKSVFAQVTFGAIGDVFASITVVVERSV